MKQVIRLTESDLHKIIKETVNKILKEDYQINLTNKGKEGWNNPISAPLCGIAFLERNDINIIERVSPQKIIDKAFMQFYIPKNKETAELTVGIINRLLTSVPLYILKCNMNVEAAEIAFSEMN